MVDVAEMGNEIFEWKNMFGNCFSLLRKLHTVVSVSVSVCFRCHSSFFFLVFLRDPNRKREMGKYVTFVVYTML